MFDLLKYHRFHRENRAFYSSISPMNVMLPRVASYNIGTREGDGELDVASVPYRGEKGLLS